MTALADYFASLQSKPKKAIKPALGILFVLFVLSQAGGFDTFIQFTILGIAIGSVYAIAAAGIVLTYTTTGVFNFAHGAVGMISAYVYFTLRESVGLATPIAIVLVIGVFAPLVGLIFERIMRSFKDAGPGTTLTVTIALTIMLIGLSQALYPNTGSGRNLDSIFGERRVEIIGVRLSWDEVAFVFVAIGIAVGLRFLLYVSRTGVAMRAVVDNPDLAALNGTKPVVIARYSWILGVMLASTAGVLFAPRQGALDPIVLTFFVLAAYGAAVVGKLKNLPLTFAGAIGLGLLENWTTGIIFVKEDSIIGDRFLTLVPWGTIGVALPGLFLLGALIFLPETKLTVGRVVGRDEPRTPSLQQSLIGAGVFIAAAAVFSAVLPGDYLIDGARAMVYAVLLLSLVVLTGYSGQISLAQYVFLGVGSWAMGRFFGGDTILGMVLAVVVCIPLGALIALPALRLQGLYLALATFAFAIFSKDILFNNDRIYGGGNQVVGRLNLFGLDFSGNRVFILLSATVFAFVGVGVLAIRRSPLGRRLSAIRDSEAACATLGLDIRNTKLVVFSISSGIAGLAGALFGGVNATVGTIDFDPINNVVLFLFAFVGGITTVSGALIGGILFALLPLVQSEQPELAGVVFAVVAVAAVLLGKQPNGLAGLLFERVNQWRGAGAVTAAERAANAAPAPTPEVSNA